MATLSLQFEDRVLKDCAIGLLLTIGRLPDNTVVIDNLAVSGHHACVFRDDDHFVVEDLDSTNGTFVNDRRVSRQTLRNGDVVLVGKHRLVFDEYAGGDAVVADEAESLMSNLGDTVFLDTHQHRALLTKLNDSDALAKSTSGKPSTPKVGILRVLGGRADQQEYQLKARTSFIGKTDAALVRLRGWFKPKLAVAIARSGAGYVATAIGGKTLINSEPVTGRHDLKDGDVLRVSGLTLEFRLKG
jgi:pSer/pThr/pTyr-binding forkhead associated (FHA) protein